MSNSTKSYCIPQSSGRAALGQFFPGQTVKVDYGFKMVLETLKTSWSVQKIKFSLVEKKEEDDLDPSIIMIVSAERLDLIFALLSFLSGNGRQLLDVPYGEKKVIIVLGVAEMGFPLYIESEIENGQRTISMKICRLKHLKKEKALIAQIG